jgi:hypothetical protein
MTEEEAKTKWCPFVRVGSERTGLGSINRDVQLGERTPSANCIASACMAWQAKTKTEQRDRRDGLPVQPGTIYLRGNIESAEVPDGGYCGLVVQPQ